VNLLVGNLAKQNPQHYAKVMSAKAKEAIEKVEGKSRLRAVGE
jgi:hypothetical protein